MKFELVPLEEKYLIALSEYWSNLTSVELKAMGVDESKLPSKSEFIALLSHQLKLPMPEKKAFAMIGLLDGKAIGHCNLNPIHYGDHAKFHLHLWNHEHRGKGFGSKMVKQSLPHFFKLFKLNYIVSEPYANNPAPNRTLKKVGFKFVKLHKTFPGTINFEQEVKRWEIKQNDIV